jgi:hypothetical protein
MRPQGLFELNQKVSLFLSPDVELMERLLFLLRSLSSGVSKAPERLLMAAMQAAVAEMDRVIDV